MNLNWPAIFLATALQFAFGFVWYTPIFGKLWGKIHGFDQVSKEKQQEMMKQMGPLLAVQILGTIVTSVVLSLFINNFVSGWHAFGIAGFSWLGFILPTQVSAVIFGGTQPKWIIKKIAIMAFASLGCLMIAAAVFYFLG